MTSDFSASLSPLNSPVIDPQFGNNAELIDPTFLDQQPKFEWDFTLSAALSSQNALSDTLGAVEFDPSDTLFATAGIARKIRVYNLNSILSCGGACDYFICTPAKLSGLRWKPYSAGRVIGSCDYDGVVTEYDLEKRVPVFERDEHGGRRVWAMDYSTWDPFIGGSASDDGTMQVWDPRCDGGGGSSIAIIRPPGNSNHIPVCAVEFDPSGGPMVAVGCADRRAYGFDVRQLSVPVFQLDGHQRTVAYVRFLDHHTVVTSGTDGCLKMWRTADQRPIRTYAGHVNARRFVGLSAWRSGGLLSCGSENNKVFVYDKRWAEPIWCNGIGPNGQLGDAFVSCVNWRQTTAKDECTLAVGGSNGVLHLFEGKRKIQSGGGGG